MCNSHVCASIVWAASACSLCTDVHNPIHGDLAYITQFQIFRRCMLFSLFMLSCIMSCTLLILQVYSILCTPATYMCICTYKHCLRCCRVTASIGDSALCVCVCMCVYDSALIVCCEYA